MSEQALGGAAVAAALPAVGLVALMVLTGAGSRRRGNRWWVLLLAATFFPVAWTVWYVRDELRTAAPRA